VHRARLWLAALAVLITASACQINVQVGVDVHADGSGTVSVGVGLDDDAVAKMGGADNLRSIVKVEDLQATGWKITGPQKESDGLTWLRASKPFADTAQASAVLGEIASGPFRDFSLVRSRSFARTTFAFDGTADFSRGIEAFSDPALTETLDGQPLGQDVAAIAQQFGGSLDDLVHITFAVRLPGAVSSNASTLASNGAVWEPKLSDPAPVRLVATSHSWRVATLAWSVLAAAAGVALVVFVALQLTLRLRRR
jgi:hypothetical protein